MEVSVSGMNALKHVRWYLMAASLVVLVQPVHGFVRQNSVASGTSFQSTPAERDGQHDFDFEIGAWKTHLSRLQHPLTGSATWVEYEGTSVVRKVWDGRANLVELEVDGSSGHIEGLSLRLYNPQSHQWSLNFANGSGGGVGPPTIGEFKNGRGEFFDQEPFNGRTILVRNVWSDITPNSCRFEQAFSDDGGKTWEVNWIATDTRAKGEADKSVQNRPAEQDGQHDFDFEMGAWKIHLKRLLHPLTSSTSWIEYDATSVTRKVWDGRADLEEFETDGSAADHIEGLTLRLYNPEAHQWSLYWADSKAGTIAGPPQIGEFKNGRGEFFCQDTFNGRSVLVRYVWSDLAPGSAHFEQSFSDDGGKTWVVNWITDQIRVKDESDKVH
jgi:hypothetical protein